MYLFRLFALIPLLVSFLLFSFPVSGHSRSLKGGVSLHEKGHNLKLKEQKPMLSGTSSIEIEQPAWIKGNVYTNNQMYMFSYWEIFPFRKKIKWKIPTKKRTRMTFSKLIVSHWKGHKPRRAGRVTVEPIVRGKERFRFYHSDPTGPSGYFELAGKTTKGFTRYRIWFNEPKDDDQ